MSDEAKVLLGVAVAGAAGYVIWRIITGRLRALPTPGPTPEKKAAAGEIVSVEYSAG